MARVEAWGASHAAAGDGWSNDFPISAPPAALERRGYAVQSSHLLAENRRVMEDHLLLVASFLGFMSQLMIVVGGLGLAASMSLAVLERTREIGVLRAIGARHRTIVAMVQIEGLVVTLLGCVLAVSVAACAWPAFRATRITTADALAYE